MPNASNTGADRGGADRRGRPGAQRPESRAARRRRRDRGPGGARGTGSRSARTADEGAPGSGSVAAVRRTSDRRAWGRGEWFAAGTGYTGEDGVELHVPPRCAIPPVARARRRRDHPRRARCPRHAAPRGRAAAARPRARAGHHAACRPASAGSCGWTKGTSAVGGHSKPSASGASRDGCGACWSRVVRSRRAGYAVAIDGPSGRAVVGEVTSGNFSPVLERGDRARASCPPTSPTARRSRSTCAVAASRPRSSRRRSSRSRVSRSERRRVR